MSVGVLLMTYGAPRDDADLPRYLAAVCGGRVPSDELVNEMRRRYRLIGGSPLVEITRAQAAALARELGEGHVSDAGMRFSPPTIGDAASDLVRHGATSLVGIVLSPQWSPTLMAGYVRALEESATSLDVPWSVPRSWHREPAFIEALAELLADAITEEATIVFSAHSLPRRVFDAEPEYVAQLRETADLVAARAGLRSERWRWAYQSAGHTPEEWLRPDLKDVFRELAASGHRDVLVVPVQFLSDHLEVLYDLDIAAAQEARASGLDYSRIRMPNIRPAFIRALAAVARGAVPPLSLPGSGVLVAMDGDSARRLP